MRHELLTFVVLLLVHGVVAGQQSTASPMKVLFIGNSYTYVNDLPSMVEGLAEAAGGRQIETARHLVGGCTLERHVRETHAIDKIREQKWDFVVLQEQSLRPVIGRDLMFQYARTLHAEIKKQDAKTVFYLTWARKHIPEMLEGADPAKSPKYAQAMFRIGGNSNPADLKEWCRQQKAGLEGGLSGAYSDIATELGAVVAPVGVAWKMALATDSSLALHRPDRSHPSPTGTYLTACVFFATLLRETPVGLPGEVKRGDTLLVSIGAEQAKRLQEIAWDAVQSSDPRSTPDIGH